MRLYYTALDCPFTEEELDSCLHDTGDNFQLKKHWEVPQIGEDPLVPLRYDDLQVYDAASITEVLERLPEAQALGVILLVDWPLILTVDASFTPIPEKIEEYYIRSATVPACVVLLSLADLTHAQALKVFKHEMGHFYGLKHCSTTPTCLMTSIAYGDFATLDSISLALCDDCKNRLKVALEV